MKLKCETVVDDSGCIRPVFNLGGSKMFSLALYTSGYLKYFHKFAGKKVKITIEILED
jgi:hypothetical protein